MASDVNRADGRVCLITGANAGIGFVTAQGLAERGATVVLLCRDRGRGEAAVAKIKQATDNDRLHLLVCDLSSQRQIRRAAEQFKTRFARLDVLINNAAIYCRQRTQTGDGLETQFAVNYLSYFLLTHLLLDLLRASAPSRVVNLTTINHHYVSLQLDDVQSQRDYEPKTVHMRSKLAVILFTFELARRLRGTGVTANCLHPGVIATNLLGQVRNVPKERRFTPEMGGAPLEEGAATPLYLALSENVAAVSGCYFENLEAVPSSAETLDQDKARRLWQMSENLCGLTS